MDKHFKIRGLEGSESELFVLPTTDKYYTDYECRAHNLHGSASWLMSLRVATVPGPIRQVVMEKVTATTIMFRFVPPQWSGGLEITSYIAEYKDTKQPWEEAR